MPDLVRIQRALLSVSDKTDLVPLAQALAARDVEIISTGGTARALVQAGVPVTPVEDVTKFPEMLDGRVKTLHPMVHAGLLALRDKPAHRQALREHDIKPIDLVCVNLYPFERTVSEPGVEQHEAIEQIDIGGPSMIRSGAKNFEHVAVLTGPRQYDRFVSELDRHDGHTTRALREELAAAAYARTSEYDAAIGAFLSRRAATSFPEVLSMRYTKAQTLRYGENPHQDAALYRDPSSTGPSVVNARQIHGKALSYNNLADAAAALELVKDLRRIAPQRPGAAVIKHTNACGGAVAGSAPDAVRAAMAGDPLAAYGGVVAVNAEVDEASSELLTREGVFLEVVVAPSFTPGAIERLTARSANIRLLEVGDRAPSPARKLDYRSIAGGMLVQSRDTRTALTEQWEVAAGPRPDAGTLAHAAVIWTVVKHLKSNAVAIGGADEGGATRVFGVGAGLVDRLTACRLACEKSGVLAKGAIAASDAFFPFPDGPGALIEAGVSVIVHPGGSKRDHETFALCEQRGVTCLVTGVRHFRH